MFCNYALSKFVKKKQLFKGANDLLNGKIRLRYKSFSNWNLDGKFKKKKILNIEYKVNEY